MPAISMFLGIIIRMFCTNEHNPPHFHAVYQGYEAIFDLDGNFIRGEMPEKQCRYIKVWAELHHEELEANWQLAISEEPPFKIDPLR